MEGKERIKVLASEIKDTAVLKIVEYLLSREDMNDKYLNEEKSLKQMIKFIKSEARKEEKNGIAMIEDEIVYNWAIHYWDETNENLKLEKTQENTNVNDSKNEINKVTKSTTKKKWEPEGQLTLFDFV